MTVSDKRSWARFTTNFADSMKVAVLSDGAFRTLVEMILWSRQELTDGIIPKGVAERRWGTRVTTDMESGVETDPLTELLTNHPTRPSLFRNEFGNYVIRDFLEHQESREEVESRKARNQANGRKGGRPRKTQRVTKSQSNEKATGVPKTKAEEEEETEEPNGSSVRGRVSTHPAPKTSKRGTRITEDWQPSEALKAWTRENAPAAANPREVAKFVDYWLSVSGSHGVKMSWDATWRNWARRTQENADRQPKTYRSQNDIMADIYQQASAQTALMNAGNFALIEGGKTA